MKRYTKITLEELKLYGLEDDELLRIHQKEKNTEIHKILLRRGIIEIELYPDIPEQECIYCGGTTIRVVTRRCTICEYRIYAKGIKEIVEKYLDGVTLSANEEEYITNIKPILKQYETGKQETISKASNTRIVHEYYRLYEVEKIKKERHKNSR